MVRRLIPLVVLWVAAGVYVFLQIDAGWIPHDEGTLAHSAERVLSGQLPHRDFDDVYSGGLTFLNALAFRLLGVNLLSPRIVLFLFFLAWLPSLYFVASRFTRPVGAAATVLLAVAWSVPNYPAAVPSWYNLFFAVSGTASLARYLDTDRRSWLFVTGVCAGLSVVFKIVGLYFVAGVLLFLAFHEQMGSARRGSDPVAPGRAGMTSYTAFASASLLVFLSGVLILLGERLGSRELVHFVVPVACLAGLFLWNELTQPREGSVVRFATLARLVGPFGLGLCLPLAIFVLPYLLSGSVTNLFQGVFVAPMTRLSFATARPPSLLATTVAVLPLVAYLGIGQLTGRFRTVAMAVGAVLLLATLPLAAAQDIPYRLVWYSVRMLVPIMTLIGVAWLAGKRRTQRAPALRRERVLLLLCVMTTASLVQFPFSTPIYFCYVAPIIVLTGLALVSSLSDRQKRFAPAAALCFYLMFAVLLDNRGFIYAMGSLYVQSDQTETLTLDRGGLRVSGEEKAEYETVVRLLREHSDGGFVYAAPDCPEVYFLSGLDNPTPTLFDFFDDPRGRTSRVLEQIDHRDVHVVAINRRPSFSDEMPRDLTEALVDRFPHATEVGRFQVRWKE